MITWICSHCGCAYCNHQELIRHIIVTHLDDDPKEAMQNGLHILAVLNSRQDYLQENIEYLESLKHGKL